MEEDMLDYDAQRALQSAAKKLAKDLLAIAELAMPTTFFLNDSRCNFARKILAQNKRK